MVQQPLGGQFVVLKGAAAGGRRGEGHCVLRGEERVRPLHTGEEDKQVTAYWRFKCKEQVDRFCSAECRDD